MSNPTGFNGKQPGHFSSSWDPNEKTPEFKELQKANKNTLASLTAHLLKILRVYDDLEGKLGDIQALKISPGDSGKYVASWKNTFDSHSTAKNRILAEIKDKVKNIGGGEVNKIQDISKLIEMAGSIEEEDQDETKKDEHEEQIRDLNKKLQAAEDKIRAMEGENNEEVINSAQYKEELEKFKKDRQELNSELLDYKIRWEMRSETDVTNKLLEALLGRPARVEEKTKRISLDTNTPVFTGSKGQNVKRWISNVEDNFVLQAIPEHLKMKAISQYVKGTPKTWHEQYKEENRSWNEFKELLVKQYDPLNLVDSIKRKLNYLKMGTGQDAYVDYVRAFTGLVARLDKTQLDETSRLFAFKEGLKPKLYQHLVTREVPVDTLEKAIEIGYRFEETRGEGEVRINFLRTKGGNFPNKKRFNDKGVDRGRIEDKICYNCGEKGHLANKCAKKSKDNKNWNGNNKQFGRPRAADGKFQKVTCHRCQEVGHIAKFCKKAKKTGTPATVANVVEVNILSLDKDDLKEDFHGSKLLVEGQLRRYGKVTCLADSGAETSVLNKKFVDKKGIRVLPSNTRIKGVIRNATEMVCGITEPMVLAVGKALVTLKFLVLDYDGADVILGWDFFEQSQAVIDPCNRRLIFPSEFSWKHLKYNPKIPDPLTEEEREFFLAEIASDAIEEPEISPVEDWPIVKANEEEMKALAEKTELPEGAIDTTKVTREEIKRVKATFRKAFGLRIFASTIRELGECTVLPHRITLSDVEPIYTPAYRRSEKEREEIRKEIAEMLKYGIISVSTSPWSSPIIRVPKPDGTFRLCTDFRKLNAKMVNIVFPMPRIMDILEKVSRSKFMSICDLSRGYWQIVLHPDSKPYTAFTTQDGHYEWNRVAFGLKGAPADFSKLMAILFADSRDIVENYLDDLVIIGGNTVEEHLANIEKVFAILQKANLKLNPNKCKFFQTEAKLLGHIVGHNKIKVDDEKVVAVRNWIPPRNVKQVQQFIGLAGYYRYFVEGFAKIAKPLYGLLIKDVDFLWTVECQESFEKLKERLTSAPILRPPDFSKRFYLYTDASGYALGGTLCQKDEEGREYG